MKDNTNRAIDTIYYLKAIIFDKGVFMKTDYEMVSLWIANNEKQIIRDVAKNNHMSMSDVIRILISNNIKNIQKDSTLHLV